MRLGVILLGAAATAMTTAFALRSRRIAHRAPTKAPASAVAPASVEPPSPPPEPPLPKRVWHQSERVPLASTNPGEAFWQMHESAPLVEPDDEVRPITVLLHGLCADSSWTCDWLQYFEMRPQWQLCPRAPHRCSGEPGYSWSGSAADSLRAIQVTLATARERHPGRLRDDAIVLAGMSQGAYAVAAIVRFLAHEATPSLHVKGIVVQGGQVRVAAADARRLGLRVAFAAGDLDGAAPAMRAEAERLRREGIDARWASLGKDEGHFTSVSTGKIMAQLVDWARGE